MTPTRRRGVLLVCFALLCGGLAASQVHERERRADAAVGPLVPVVVASRDLPAGRRLDAGDLSVRRAPARFLPPDALQGAAGLAGARTAVAVPAGGYLTAGALGGGAPARGPRPLRAGERALELSVAGAGLAGANAGARVDVLVTTEGGQGEGRTFVALEDAELLALRPAGAAEAAGGQAAGGGALDGGAVGGGALATLRVTAHQAVYLTAVSASAREVRLLVRPPGDRRRIG
jgi:pilus assembly protein CpaB